MTKSNRFAFLKSSLALLLLFVGTAALAHAQSGGASSGPVPELDPAMIGEGVALLGGTILLLRGARKR